MKLYDIYCIHLNKNMINDINMWLILDTPEYDKLYKPPFSRFYPNFRIPLLNFNLGSVLICQVVILRYEIVVGQNEFEIKGKCRNFSQKIPKAFAILALKMKLFKTKNQLRWNTGNMEMDSSIGTGDIHFS